MSTLSTAVAHHQAGRLDEAERLYRAALAATPDNADALHFLGLLTHQREGGAEAVAMLEVVHGLRSFFPRKPEFRAMGRRGWLK